jgi:hypothetical protein
MLSHVSVDSRDFVASFRVVTVGVADGGGRLQRGVGEADPQERAEASSSKFFALEPS